MCCDVCCHVSHACRRQAGLNPMQVSVLRALMEWRDRVCREEDESTGYVLPQAPMIHLARNMPGRYTPHMHTHTHTHTHSLLQGQA